MKHLHRLLLLVASAAFFIASAQAQNVGTVTDHAIAVGRGAGVQGFRSLICGNTQVPIGQTASDPICAALSGDVTMTAAGVTAIGANKVTNSQLATMTANTTKCNATAGTAAPTDCNQATMRTNLALVPGTNVQAWDADLDCLAALATNGIVARTGAGTCVATAVSSTDGALALWNGTAGTALKNSVVNADPTTGKLSKTGGGGIPIEASNTSSAACSGCVGEYLDNPVGGGATAGTTVPGGGAVTNVNTLSLGAGDWMVSCGVIISPNATLTGLTEVHTSLSTDGISLTGSNFGGPNAEHVAWIDNQAQIRMVGPARWNNSSTRTVYCNQKLTYSGGSALVQSWMFAYRFH
jgi:hypothetical protein